MDNQNEILAIIDNWSYESPDNTVFDRNADALTFGSEKNPMVIHVKKAPSLRYSFSILGKNGEAFITPGLMRVADIGNQHIMLVNDDKTNQLSIYLKRLKIWKIIYIDKGQGEDAIFIDFASNHPAFINNPRPSPELLYEVALNLYNSGDKNYAVRLFNKAIEQGLYRSPCLVQIGIFTAERGDDNNAHNFFVQAIASDTKNGNAYYNLGVLLLKHDKFDDAIKRFESAIEFQCPNISVVYFNRASALLSKTVIEEQRLSVFDRLSKYSVPDSIKQSYLLCYSDIMTAMELTKAKDADILFVAGRICEKLGRIAEARINYSFAGILGDNDARAALKRLNKISQ